MKNKLTGFIYTWLLIAISYTSFSQGVTKQSVEIENMIAKKRSYNSKHGFGYRIQLYNGYEEKARSIKANFDEHFSGNFSKLVYKAPEWKVHVGNYKTKLEADKDIEKYQKKYAGIIVIPMGK